MAQINSVQARPKRDIIDTILAGLNIAKGVYDIKTNAAQLEKAESDQDLMKQNAQRQQEGFVTPQERLKIEETHTVTRDPEVMKSNPNATILKDKDGPFAALRIPKAPGTREMRLRQPDGTEQVSIVPDVPTAQPYQSFAAPKNERLQLTEVYDPATGQTVKKWVSPDANVSYPQPPKDQNPNLLFAKEKYFGEKLQDFNDKTAPLSKTFSALGQFEEKLGFKLEDFDASDGTVIKTDPATGQKVKVVPDLPGISFPGLGRVDFYNKEARELYSTAQKIFNVELKDRSGAAVTNTEMDRLKIEFEQGKYNTEAEMIGALKRYREAAAEALAHQETPFRLIKNIDGKSVVDVFDENKGFTSRNITGTRQTRTRDLTPQEKAAALLREMEQ